MRVLKSGYLVKCGGNIKSWKKRYIEIQDNGLLIYYEDKGGKKKGEIDLVNSEKIGKWNDISTADKLRNISELDQTFAVKMASRTYTMVAESEAECMEWITMITNVKNGDIPVDEYQGYGSPTHENKQKASSQPDGAAVTEPKPQPAVPPPYSAPTAQMPQPRPVQPQPPPPSYGSNVVHPPPAPLPVAGYPPNPQAPPTRTYPPTQQPQPVAYPPRPVAYPPAQPTAYPPRPVAYPPAQPTAYPPRPVAYPPAQPTGYPPAQPAGYPPAQQNPYPQQRYQPPPPRPVYNQPYCPPGTRLQNTPQRHSAALQPCNVGGGTANITYVQQRPASFAAPSGIQVVTTTTTRRVVGGNNVTVIRY